MDRLQALREHSERLVTAMDEATARDLVGLVREHRAVMAEIAQLTPNEQTAGDPIDEIAQRRAARRASTA